MVFVISSPFLSVLAASFSIGTENVMYVSEFSPEQVIFFQILALTLLW